MPHSRVLDIGCGCLRVGYWLIKFLDKKCYYGIEPNGNMLDHGVRILVEPEVIQANEPEFNHNADFDFAVFQASFDYLVARSIWTHCTKQQIQAMLDGFLENTNSEAKFVTSYVRPTLMRRDYMGTKWVGRSHESDDPGVVSHSLKWIRTECDTRGLVVDEIKDEVLNFGNQTWLRIKREEA